MEFLIIILIGFLTFWLLIVLPQRRRERAHSELVGGLKAGDYVVTAGGLYGTVTDLGEDDLGLEIAPDIEVRVAKRAIGAVIPPDEIEDVEEGEPEAAEEPATGESAEPDGR